MQHPPPHLTLRLPDGQTSALPLDPARPLIIGRDPACDIIANDPSVSGRHAELRIEAGSIAIRDLGSRYGILVDNKPVTLATLRAGDTAWLGDVALSVPAAALPPATAAAAVPAALAPATIHASPTAPSPPRRTRAGTDRFVLVAMAIAVIVLVAVAALFVLS